MANALSALSALEVLRLPGCRKLTARAVERLAEAGGDPAPPWLQMQTPLAPDVCWQLPAWRGGSVPETRVGRMSGGGASRRGKRQGGISPGSTLHPVLASRGADAVRSLLQGDRDWKEELPAQGRG